MIRAKARELRKTPTEAERLLWRHLRLRQVGGYKFRRQQPLGRYIVDFVCFEKKLVVEVNGGQHSEHVHDDEERSAWLGGQGFRVLSFWNHEVLQDVEVVKEVIWKGLGSGDGPPTLILPHKGGGKNKRGGSGGEKISHHGIGEHLKP